MKVKPQQISLFEIFKEPEIIQNYWKQHFNWGPAVNQLARIDTTIAFSQSINDKKYCYCMRVMVKSITDDIAIVETTEEWEAATFGSDKAGELWQVNINDLAPIFN